MIECSVPRHLNDYFWLSSVCLEVCQSICQSVTVSLFVCLPFCLSICLSVSILYMSVFFAYMHAFLFESIIIYYKNDTGPDLAVGWASSSGAVHRMAAGQPDHARWPEGWDWIVIKKYFFLHSCNNQGLNLICFKMYIFFFAVKFSLYISIKLREFPRRWRRVSEFLNTKMKN